jgi:hypothetical protein
MRALEESCYRARQASFLDRQLVLVRKQAERTRAVTPDGIDE